MRITSFIAIGDSFTEGLDDPRADGGMRGWADRVAERLAVDNPSFRYANLAVRGRLLGQVIEEQVPRAIELKPDLVSLVGGGNDLLRPRADPDALAKAFAGAVRRLRAAGSEVLLFTGVDPRDAPLINKMRGRAAVFYLHLRSIADIHGCHLVDQWSMQSLRDWRAWSRDRLHLSAEGHRLVAARVCEVLGVPCDDDWRRPPTRGAGRGGDLRWAREHLVPWVGRRLTGRSSGDEITAKRPDLRPFP
ncbi:SGNH/GDSL hydrolase family protein [Rhizohabitans arisaemae]|uniref:SGNH/GDSL hydrolase family protein n=1 Tax=Rhizohabitans arisaemae TaxID=2720610 RepID=UPI0024B13282|nr:SGNH/GDSL hydrolase family protein [Rhizohabitans arisaemae]